LHPTGTASKEELAECQRQLEELLEKAEDMEQLERGLQVMEELSSYAPYVESFKSLSQREEQEIKEIKSLREKACQTLPSEGAVPEDSWKNTAKSGKDWVNTMCK
jgi:hypothetical protein